MLENQILTQEEKLLNIRLEEIYKENDKLVSYVLYSLGLLIFVMGAIYSKPLLGLLSSTLFLIIYWLSIFFIQNRELKLYGIAISFVLVMIGLIAVGGGSTEIRFSFFILVFLLCIYQNTKIIHFGLIGAYLFVIISYVIALDKENPFYEFITTNLLEKNAITKEKFIISIIVVMGCHAVAIFLTNLFRERTIKQIYTSIAQEKQLRFLKKNQVFADEIAKGNFEMTYISEDEDLLGMSLINMRDNLKEAANRDMQEKFINHGVFQIDEILRKNSNDLQQLGDQLMSKIVSYLNAAQGAFYIVQKNINNDDTYLELIACYAYNRKKYLHLKIEEGEGFVGQCYLEQKSIYRTDLPQEYFKIRSGLGEILPKYLIITPLMANQNVIGVLEIAFLKDLQEYEKKFIEKISEDIAITLISVKANEETKKLYEQSRIATEELQAREEEMRQNVEELATTQEEMHKTQKFLEETKLKAQAFIEGSLSGILSFDNKGKIDEFNSAFLKMFGYSNEQVKNMNIIQIIPEFINLQFDKYVGNVIFTQGKTQTEQTLELRIYINKVDIFGKEFFLAYIRDITEEKKIQEQYQTKIISLESEILLLKNASQNY
jgi:methyl-accepting chemotaxis protein